MKRIVPIIGVLLLFVGCAKQSEQQISTHHFTNEVRQQTTPVKDFRILYLSDNQ